MERVNASRVYRGFDSITNWATGGSASSTATTGWRPCLELFS